MRVVRERLAVVDERIVRAQRERLLRLEARRANAKARLESLSPLAVLNRGYALVFDEGGALIRDAASAPDGSLISTRFAQSTLRSQVIKS